MLYNVKYSYPQSIPFLFAFVFLRIFNNNNNNNTIKITKGARWYSMEMAGIVCYTGAGIIKVLN